MNSGVIDADFPVCLVIDDESRDVLVSAERMSGFFFDAEEPAREVTFERVHRLDVQRRASEVAVLEILNRTQDKIGEYYVGRAVRASSEASRAGEQVTEVSFRQFGGRCDLPEAAGIWQRWASGGPVSLGEWSLLPVGDQDAWLHVVQNSWFASGRLAARYGSDEVVAVDGAQFSSRSGFYCALGEAVNGPGGYFGSNLDAVFDCFRRNESSSRLSVVRWNNLSRSKSLLGSSFVASVSDVLSDAAVELVAG